MGVEPHQKISLFREMTDYYFISLYILPLSLTISRKGRGNFCYQKEVPPNFVILVKTRIFLNYTGYKLILHKHEKIPSFEGMTTNT
jgi:hypothetical protein